MRESGASFDVGELLRELEAEMVQAAGNLEYERAALLRDQIAELKTGTGIDKIESNRKPVKYSAGKKHTGKKPVGAKKKVF